MTTKSPNDLTIVQGNGPVEKQKKTKKERPAPPESSCHYWIPSKHRYCKLTKRPGANFCGEHDIYDAEGNVKRIPCPYKGKHFVEIADLEAHKKICVSRPKPLPIYHVKDLNVFNKNATSASHLETGLSAKEYFQKIERIEFIAFADKVRHWYCKVAQELNIPDDGNPTAFEKRILSHREMEERLRETKEGKHAVQQASLLGNMERSQLLRSDWTYVEFGCGKGELTNCIQKCVGDNGRYALVDRSYHRLKLDKEFKSSSSYRLAEIDIKDLDLSKFLRAVEPSEKAPFFDGRKVTVLVEPSSESAPSDFHRPIMAVSKHLCGAATDLTLSCLFNHVSQADDHTSVECILIALCCHQVCTPQTYISLPYFLDTSSGLGMSTFEFELICCTSTWAVCGDRVTAGVGKDHGTDQLQEHWSGLDYEARQRLGWTCKRLLDLGRVFALRTRGFKAELFYYVEKETSLENMALLASRTRT